MRRLRQPANSPAPAVTPERLLAVVASFAGRRLVVAGDYVLDRFVYGHPKRVSREAPVLILRFWKQEDLPGGAGNAAANVRALGGIPVPVGVIGEDEEAERLTAILREREIETSGLLAAAGYATPTKTRILGGGPHSIKQQIVRYDRESELPRTAEFERGLDRAAERAARGADAAVVSDYGYGAVRPKTVELLRRSLSPSAPIVVDARRGLATYRGADAITPNEEELQEASGLDLGDSADALESAASDLASRVGSRTVLVTRGSRGMALFERGLPPRSIPVHGTDQVADVTGAGDTVIATFSLALASGATPFEAALLANFAGGVVVMKMGTAVVTREELELAIRTDRTILG